MNMNTNTYEYLGYFIEYNFYGKKEYTVQICGDDVWFKSLGDAKRFIEDMQNNSFI